jgi:hypothetical protein
MSASSESNPVVTSPNRIAFSERAINLLLAVLLLGYGAAGLATHSIKFSLRGNLLVQLHGRPAWLMAFALILGACVFASVIIDHYDTRSNEGAYKTFRWFAIRLGWCLAAAALLAHLYQGFTQ